MKILSGSCGGILAVMFVCPAYAGSPSETLDLKYGVAERPAYIKHFEADKTGRVLLNPYLQAASREFPAILDRNSAPYNWVIDAEGRLMIVPEVPHPLGRVYEKGYRRPEDNSRRGPGTRENYGHPSATGGAPGRISGEILYDAGSNAYTVNNKSGRYTKHNSDRTPGQLAEAARLMRETVDPGPAAWGPVIYLLDYAPAELKEKLPADPRFSYYKEQGGKTRPCLIVMQGGPPQAAADKFSTPADAAAAAGKRAEE